MTQKAKPTTAKSKRVLLAVKKAKSSPVQAQVSLKRNKTVSKAPADQPSSKSRDDSKKPKTRKLKRRPTKSAAKLKKTVIIAEPWLFRAPGSDCLKPRDGKYIERSEDYLFLAVLVERSRESGWVKFEKNPDSTFCYVPSPPPDAPAGQATPHHYSTRMLRRLLSRRLELWWLRVLIQNEMPPPSSITIQGSLLCEGGKWHKRGWKQKFFRMRHPLEIGKIDAFLAGLHTQQFFTGCDLRQVLDLQCVTNPLRSEGGKLARPIIKGGETGYLEKSEQLICPVDGLVVPIEVFHSSPASAWRNLCGRSYASLHCPECLAVLYREKRPRVMN